MGNHQGLGLGKEDEERKAERRVSSGWSCNMMEAGLAATKRGFGFAGSRFGALNPNPRFHSFWRLFSQYKLKQGINGAENELCIFSSGYGSYKTRNLHFDIATATRTRWYRKNR
ncbi:hypothetical protein MRB53_016191 [Persea americana]|uniref:Uncharacterized protein n=1 Tax=Persea americana TaxID=3435 RepID=A0ACC2M2S3_PERAE|nr:hypothetical protein MRB53_016191 [Persea americana]